MRKQFATRTFTSAYDTWLGVLFFGSMRDTRKTSTLIIVPKKRVQLTDLADVSMSETVEMFRRTFLAPHLFIPQEKNCYKVKFWKTIHAQYLEQGRKKI
jgi:hypothetical protein